MKLICTGDLHLGASPDLGAAAGDRLADQERVWQKIARLARDEECEALLFAGDAFHRRRPTPAEILAFRSGLKILNEHDVDVIAIAGNHDVESAALPNALLTSEPHAYYEVSSRPEIYYTRGSEGIAVATLPWTPPAQLVASRNGGVRDALHREVAELLIETARGLRAQIEEGKTAVLLAHWSVSQAVTPTGADVGLFREVVLPLPDLHTLGFDAVVLGHIHLAQVLSPSVVMRSENGTEAVTNQAPVFYVGSPAVVDWGETKSEHGVFILDTEERSVRQVMVEDRRFVTVEVDLQHELTQSTSLGLDETDLIAAAIAEHIPLDEAVVRLRYRATAEQARRLDIAAIRGFVAEAGAHKLASVQAEIIREDRVRVEGVDETLGVREALDLWIGHQGVEEKRATALRDLTAQLLEERAA